MAIFIIAKYAHSFSNPTVEDSIFGSYTARQCFINKRTYASIAEAQPDLEKVQAYNPSVGYGIVQVD